MLVSRVFSSFLVLVVQHWLSELPLGCVHGADLLKYGLSESTEY